MKKHNLFKVVMISIAIVMLLSWVVPAIYYSNYSGWVGTTDAAKVEIGLLEVVNNCFAAVWNFADIGIFILIIGGFYGVLHKVSGYRNLLDSIANGFKNREWIFMTIIVVAFALLSSMAGLSIPLLALVPFVISVILLMGYDKITAAMVTVGSIVVGLMGSVFNSSNTEAIDQMLLTTADKDVLLKILLLVVGIVLLLFNVIIYSRKHKNNKPVEDSSYIPEKSSKKVKVWPIVVIFDITLIILTLGFISWELFAGEGGITWAQNVLDAINEFDVFGFKVFEALFGFTNAFGNWTLVEASFVLVLSSGLLAFVYKMNFNDYLTNFMNGAKRAIKPAVLVVMSYVIMMLSSNIWCSIAKPLFEITGNINVFTMILVALVISLISGSLSNGAYLVLAYFLFFILKVNDASTLAAADITLISLIWQSINGIVMLIAPTSVVMLAILGYLHIPYGKWLKSIWLLFFELLAVTSIVLTIISITI